MNLKEAAEFLEVIYTGSRGYMAPWIEGPSGIGKTTIVKELAQRHDVKCVVINVFIAAPNEICGYAMPDHERKCMTYYDSESLASLNPGDVLLLDEIEKASPAVLNALLTIVEDRRTPSGKDLSDIMIVGCANHKSYQSIPLPQRQRFDHVLIDYKKVDCLDWIEDELGIALPMNIPVSVLNDPIENDFNVLTPRKLTKALMFAQGSCAENAQEIKRMALDNMWGKSISLMIMKSVGKKKVTTKQVLNLLNDKLEDKLDDSIVRSLSDVPLRQLLDEFEKLPEWEEIKKVLESEGMQ